MRVFVILGLIIFVAIGPIFSAFSQNLARIEKIRNELRITTSEIDRFTLLSDLAFEFRFSNPDTTIYYTVLAEELGKKIDLKLGLARPINFRGVALNYKGDRLAAYDAYSQALAIATQQKDTLQIAHAKNNIGRVFFDQGLLSRAFDLYLEAIPLFEALPDSTGMAYGYQSLASLYRTQKDFVKAEVYYRKALELRKKLGNTRDIMAAWSYLGRMYNESEDYTNAISCFLKADSGYSVINDKINLAETRIFIAENYIEDDQLKAAEQVFEKGYEVIIKSGVQRFLPRLFITLGKIDFLKGDFSKAKKNLQKGLTHAKSIKDLALQMDAHLYLSKVAEKLADYNEKISNFNQYLIIKDSLKDLDVARQVERLQFELQIEKKDQENQLLKLREDKNEITIQQQRYQNLALFIVLVSFLALGLMIIRNSKKRSKANSLLANQNSEIEKQGREILKQNEALGLQNQRLVELNHEKDTLMSIVAHDLKSPLNRIKGLIEVIRLEGGLDADKTKLLHMIETSSQSGLDLITDLLDVHELEENRDYIKAPLNLHDFINKRAENFRSLASAKGMAIKVDSQDIGTILSDINYLTRIVDNLVSNAIKFSPKGSNITISAGMVDSTARISIKDQGPGFQDLEKKFIFQKFKRLSARPTGGESSNGLGLAIVKTLVDRLEGEIILNSVPGSGSEFIIRFPS